MNTSASILFLAAATMLDREVTREEAASGSMASRGRPTLQEIQSLSDFTSFFRLSQHEIDQIFPFLQLPDPIVTPGRDSERAEVAFLLVLAYLGGARLAAIERVFKRSSASCSRLIHTTLSTIDTQWKHLLNYGRAHGNLLAPDRLLRYARRLSAKGCPLTGVWGFIDGTLFPIARPVRNQREMYTGWKRIHAIKFQALTTPDGLIWLHGPSSGRRNDNFLLHDSALLSWLNEHSHGPTRPNGTSRSLFLYGDKAYSSQGRLVAAYKGLFLTPRQKLFNRRMASIRIGVEWGIGSIKTMFPRSEIKRMQRTLLTDIPEEVRVATLLRNAVSCVSGNENSISFRCETPRVEHYFS